MQQPKFTVTVEGVTHTAQIQQGDITRWEMQRAINNWPDMSDAPNLYMTHVCWSALKRQGLIDRQMPFEHFIDVMTDVTLEGTEEVDPTRTEPTPDS